MRFKVENLGPIKEAEVDLAKPLIVLTGPNNSGKTYFAWAVYGFDRFEPTGFRATAEVAAALVANQHKEQSLAPVLELGEYVAEMALQFSKSLAAEFGGVPEHLSAARVGLPTGPDERKVAVGKETFNVADTETFGMLQVLPRQAAIFGYWSVLSEARSVGAPRSQDPSGSVDATRLRARVNAAIAAALHRGMRRWSTTVVFPVERLAINTFAKELVQRRSELIEELRLIVDQGSERSLREEVVGRVERYPRAIRDAIHDATQVDIYRNRKSPLADLADELESTILGGKVTLSEDNVLEFTPDRSAATHLRIQQTASVVKSLASLVFYLRHRARGDERLIIDEPELNLHPDNQRKVARILAKMVNRGIQVIISTHSDYVIRELNNLIMLSQDSEAAREVAKELDIQPAMTLRPDQLGVYLFDVDGSCKEVEVRETGFEVETIDREIHRMNQDAQAIYYRLFDEE